MLFPTITRCVRLMAIPVVSFVFSACQEPAPVTLPGIEVPEGFTVEEAVLPGLVKYPMFATLDNRGRLFIAESSGHTTSTEEVLANPTFFIRLLDDTDHDGVYDKSVIFADSVPYPMGGTFYQGSFYTAAPPHLLKLTDTDNDGIADERQVILTGWLLSHNAATLSGPFLGPDGWMYLCDARRGFDITTREGRRLKGKGARIWRCRPDGSGLEAMAGGGFDNTIEMIFMPSGETIGTMTYFTDPRDGMRDAIMHWVEGGVYPKDHASIAEDELKMTGQLMPVMTKLARVSHAGIIRYRSKKFGDDIQGNLFTAEFNTGRLMRHSITPTGATFQTQSEPFLTSTVPDFHPTDVLEDADGSLLFVNTGGWFIAGCPLSVVAKTDVTGNIFRIRKTGSPDLSDPWGHEIDFGKLSTEKVASFIEDDRFAVRDNALEELVRRGTPAVVVLEELLKASNHETRIAAVFALSRIGSPEAMARVVKALDDEHTAVRVAAARASGLARESRAVDKLVRMVAEDEPPAQRQAATALGQIGDSRAVEPLLVASSKNKDRFAEHAIIYSLITLNNKGPLLHALRQPLAEAKKCALIALDQMDESPLTKGDLKPLLLDSTGSVRNTALWVLSHRPSWGDVVLSYLEEQPKLEKVGEEERKVLMDLIVTFAHDEQVQRWIAKRLSRTGVPDTERLAFLDVVQRVRLKDFPAAWKTRLMELLREGSSLTQERVLAIVKARQLSGFENTLTTNFLNTRLPLTYRMKSLDARMHSRSRLSPAEFRSLLTFLDSTQVSSLRQSAVAILGQSDLSSEQLMVVARKMIPGSDAFLLPSLVNVFEGCKDNQVLTALIEELSASPARLELLPKSDLERVFNTFPSEVKESSEALMKMVSERDASRLAVLNELESNLATGDVGSGRALFYGKAMCSTCHAVSGNGAVFGPDLTNVGEIRSRHDILEAIVYPSASFAREYETVRIETRQATYSGIVSEQYADEILLATAPGTYVRIPVKDIVSTETRPMSMMPPGLHQQLTIAEFSDLIAYLRSLPDGLGHLRSAHQ